MAMGTLVGCNSANDASSSPIEQDARSSDQNEGDGSHERGDSATDDILVIFPAQFTQEGMAMRMLAAGDPVDLWNAPQGGHVVLAGAKVKNLTSDTATLKVRFRQPDTGHIVAEEGRTVKMLPVPGEPGLMQPDIRSRSQVSNVPLCPSYGPLGTVDQTLVMEVTMTALYTAPVESGTTTLLVVPRCSTPDDEAFCRCECEANYFLGKCPGDGGRSAPPSDGGPNAPGPDG
jgi:hypothetical protein